MIYQLEPAEKNSHNPAGMRSATIKGMLVPKLVSDPITVMKSYYKQADR
jgi:hypothetical protein